MVLLCPVLCAKANAIPPFNKLHVYSRSQEQEADQEPERGRAIVLALSMSQEFCRVWLSRHETP